MRVLAVERQRRLPVLQLDLRESLLDDLFCPPPFAIDKHKQIRKRRPGLRKILGDYYCTLYKFCKGSLRSTVYKPGINSFKKVVVIYPAGV